MLRDRILAIILAGGEGSRLRQLTDERPKPSLSFGGVYQLIDFPLSNCVHSGIDDVWVVMQYQPGPLQTHLRNGRPWDLDRNRGGLRVLQPFTGAEESGFHQGNADALYRHRSDIREAAPDLVLVLSADHLYAMDFRQVVETHQKHNAEVTMVVTPLPENEDATRFGNVQFNARHRITRFDYKPDKPQSDWVTTEIFLYSARPLLQMLDDLAQQAEQEKGKAELEDFGHELLPEFVKRGKVYAHKHEGYWRDVGTVEAYHAAHMDLLDKAPLNPQDESWPILTRSLNRMPSRVQSGAKIENSLLSSGCEIAGKVVHSVIAPDVVIEKGAVVENSVISRGAIIESGARVKNAVVIENARLAKGTYGRAGRITLSGAQNVNDEP
jgi:glucose-1-phosphate adenylyltransferase